MKATVKRFGDRYEVIGLHKAARDLRVDNEKETYEMVYLYSLGSKSYKTIENAIKAIIKKDIEYVDANSINMVCGLD